MPTTQDAQLALTVTFSNLTPDTYTFTAQAFPATGAGFASPVTATLVVTGTRLHHFQRTPGERGRSHHGHRDCGDTG